AGLPETSGPEPDHDAENLTIEPTAPEPDPPIAPEEPRAAIGEHRISPNEPSPSPLAPRPRRAAIRAREISPNEPTAPAAGHPIVPEDPATPAGDWCPEQEPEGTAIWMVGAPGGSAGVHRGHPGGIGPGRARLDRPACVRLRAGLGPVEESFP